MCIRSMIDEIVRLKQGERMRLPGDRKRQIAVPPLGASHACSDRAGQIHKVEPSQATIKELEQASVCVQCSASGGP